MTIYEEGWYEELILWSVGIFIDRDGKISSMKILKH
jgi:hypothetical protein